MLWTPLLLLMCMVVAVHPFHPLRLTNVWWQIIIDRFLMRKFSNNKLLAVQFPLPLSSRLHCCLSICTSILVNPQNQDLFENY